MTDPWLATLNAEQRRAVEHGAGEARPLLIIAGAGSGKTNTLAHRVAHLIVHGADPRRILLLTFSRRAAAEMTRRVERIAAQALAGSRRRDGAGPGLVGHLPRDRRAPAARIRPGDRPRPRLHDPRSRGFGRPDQPDPPRPRLLQDREAVSRQGHLPRHLFARGQHRDVARGGAGRVVPWCARLGRRAARAVRRLCRGQAAPERARLRRPAALLGAHDGRCDDRRRGRRPLRSRAGRRISGHQPPAGLDPAGAQADRRRPHRRRRRRAVDLFVPRRDGAQHPRLSAPFRTARRDRHARAQLPLDPADPGGRERGDRAGQRALHQEPVVGTRLGRTPAARERARRERAGALRGGQGAGAARGRPRPQAAGGAVSRLAPQRRRSRSSWRAATSRS